MTETTGRMGAGAGERLLSLDAFRGLTIAGMILVNKRIGIIEEGLAAQVARVGLQ